MVAEPLEMRSQLSRGLAAVGKAATLTVTCDFFHHENGYKVMLINLELPCIQ